MRFTRTCDSVSAMAAVGLPFAVRAAASSTRPVAANTFASIWSSNPLFQSPFKARTEGRHASKAGAADPDNSVAEPAAAIQDSNILAVYVTVPDLEQGMFCTR